MKSPEYVESKLVNYTTADRCKRKVKNNRYHYFLYFSEDIGWQWLYGQVSKTSHKTDTELEMWKFRPTMGAVEVREVERRADIDDDQQSMFDYE